MTKKKNTPSTELTIIETPSIETTETLYQIEIEDRGLSPYNLDRTGIEQRITRFNRTRYTIQIPTTGGDRKFISHTLRHPTSWKFQSLQFDTLDLIGEYLKTEIGEDWKERGYKITPFKNSWIETFHRII